MSRENLAQHVEDGRIAVDEVFSCGMVRCEGKGEQARDLLKGGVLSEKGASITLHAAYRFRTQTERSAGYLSACGHAQAGSGPHKTRYLPALPSRFDTRNLVLLPEAANHILQAQNKQAGRSEGQTWESLAQTEHPSLFLKTPIFGLRRAYV